MKYLMANTFERALLLAGAAASMTWLGGCGGQSASKSGEGVQVASGAPEPGAKSLASAPRVLSAAEKAAQQKALAELKRRTAEKQTRALMEIAPWARGKLLTGVPVRKGDKVFALTFDDGPWPVYTRQILRILKENDAKATFYMVGSVVADYPELAREVVRDGHALGNHSWDHPSRPRDAVRQVQRTNAEIKRATGFSPTSFRPPYGIVASMAREAMREGQPVLIWTSDSHDWKRPGSSRIASNVLRSASEGGVALLHDGGGNREQTVAALPTIISGLKRRGYKLVTVPELLRHRVAPKPAAKPTARPKAAQKGSRKAGASGE